ncbi:type II CRISPR RNA-guided endonuclease Cas9 [Sulfurimonas crateris]|uniref:CRISPR-associated endonuclease Cas9 n=1 Tax=Sulfurimonas crateris TaxID=2574727 RepID=A0A4U2ZCB7_9BACT|nr:type II CRISPR RNA-guided endonuclease Cas9 [Sulfurimonas crateris]TKI70841.1 type II CRISPR RNA-guided endonuclease Cas9 [Sulfurimonas crateris]
MKILSLDLGVTSCGYSVMQELESNSYSLLDYGVVMRDNPYDGGTQQERREKKQSRNLLDKKKKRIKDIKQLFTYYNLIYQEKNKYDIWKLRAIDTFERKLDNDELFAIFRFMAKHRGYKSLKIEDLIAEIEAKEKIGDCQSDEIQEPKDLEKFSETLAYLDALKCKNKEKTAVQIIWELESQKESPTFRNHGNYRYMIRREDIEKEIKIIIEAQQKFNFFDEKQKADEFTKKLQNIILPQEAVTLNPDNINNCLIYKDKKCAPTFSYSFDIFNLYKLIADLKIDGINAYDEQKEELLSTILNDIKKFTSKTSYSVKDFKKILGIDNEHVKINNFQDYKTIKGKKEQNSLIKFNFLPSFKKLNHEILNTILKEENFVEILDEIATELHLNINPQMLIEEIEKVLKKHNLDFTKDEIRDFTLELHKHKSKGTSNYSLKALKDLTALMKDGKNESSAKEILGVSKSESYSHFLKGIKYLKPQNKEGQLQYEIDENRISNHIVKSLVSWALRVITDLHDKYGPFDIIKLESTRELSQPDDVKRDIKSANDKNEKEWQNLITKYTKHFEAKGLNPKNNKEYLIKLKLWEQQNELGIYSHKVLGIDEILSDKTEIEHIVPRACGGSNAEYNKAIDLKDENAKKGNKLPLDYLSGEKREIYINFVEELKKSYKINMKKKINLLAESLDKTFKEVKDDVSLHATSYTEKLLGEILKRYYPFTDKLKENQRVMSISGRATSYLRRILSIDNKSRDTNFHHAEDAILLGVMSKTYLQNISTNFEKNYELTEQNAKENFKKIIPLIEGASPNQIFAHIRESYMENIEESPFYKALDGTLKTPTFWVSKKPIGTKAHNETIQSKKNLAYYVPVTSLLDKVKPSHKMSSDEFYQKFNKEIYEKIQVVQDNPNDYTAIAFAKKRDTVVNILNLSAFSSTKDEKTELDKKLRDVMSEPLYDVNSNEIRRVKRVGEDASIEVRGGLAYTAPSLVSLRCGFTGEKKLKLQRVDIRTYVKNKITQHHQMDIFNNDLVEIFVEKSKILESKAIGLLKGFTESKGGRSNLRHPKYPLLKEKQPFVFQNEFSIGSTCGIKKYKTDATGKVLGFYYLGKVLNNEKELFAKVLSYKAL